MKKPVYIRLVFYFLVAIGGQAIGQSSFTFNVIMRSSNGWDTLWDGRVIDIYSFNRTLSSIPDLPGPVIYCNQGDTVSVHAFNKSRDHHTIHLHGLDVDTRNDGDPMTSFHLGHDEDTTYTFIATHPGTYLYHCHVADVVHVQMGMYGLIVVHAPAGAHYAWSGGPSYDVARNWLFSEVDAEWHDSVPMHDTTTGVIVLPRYQPEYFLINGKSGADQKIDSIQIEASVGQRVYLRIASIMFGYQRITLPTHLNAWVIDSDGRPLPDSVRTDTLVIMPGERYGLILSPSVSGLDSVRIEYMSMNTDTIWHTDFVHVTTLPWIGLDSESAAVKPVLYPNPGRGTITVDLKNPDGLADIHIYDLAGRERTAWVERIATGYRVTLENAEPGVYCIQIHSGEASSVLRYILVP